MTHAIGQNIANLFGVPVPVHKIDEEELQRRHDANPPIAGEWAFDMLTGRKGIIGRVNDESCTFVSYERDSAGEIVEVSSGSGPKKLFERIDDIDADVEPVSREIIELQSQQMEPPSMDAKRGIAGSLEALEKLEEDDEAQFLCRGCGETCRESEIEEHEQEEHEGRGPGWRQLT